MCAAGLEDTLCVASLKSVSRFLAFGRNGATILPGGLLKGNSESHRRLSALHSFLRFTSTAAGGVIELLCCSRRRTSFFLTMTPRRAARLALIWCWSLVGECLAALKLANTLGSHMVLQRAPLSACLWGWTEPLSQISISIDGSLSAQGKAAVNGGWKVCLGPQPAGGPYTITVASSSPGGAEDDTVVLRDVLFGEVWLCSGQSNMQFTVSQVFNASLEASKAADYPSIRMFSVALNTSTTPVEDISSPMLPWTGASPTSLGGPGWQYFSAACWFFGRELRDRLGVPIGLISSSYGSTQVKAWSSPDSIAECAVGEGTGDPSPSTLSSSKQQMLRGTTPRARDYYRPALNNGFSPDASWCYNAMIHPLLSMVIKGVVWSQGEQDIYAPREYRCQFPAMIRDWRRKFQGSNANGVMPFGFTQLAGYNDALMGVTDEGVTVGQMRLVQYVGLKEPGTFMAVTYDLNDDDSPYGPVHYRDKQDVGLRLALAADYYVYGGNTALPYGPTARTVTSYVYGGSVLRVMITYEGVGTGLQYSGHNLFELVVSDTATEAVSPRPMLLLIGRDTVMVEFDLPPQPAGQAVAGPRILRYAVRNNPCPSAEKAYVGVSCGLYSSAGLPALPFSQRL